MTERRLLRKDLTSVLVSGGGREQRIIVDEISGRFSRVADHIWRRLREGSAEARLWEQAAAAGWTVERRQPRRAVWNPWSIRLPLGPIDGIARRLADFSGWLFAPAAVVCWSLLILAAVVLVATRWDQVSVSSGLLGRFLAEANPFWIGATFVATKGLHELGHAVMCRRIGCRPGRVGLLLLCGIPCPYCDVTDVWRQPSRFGRIAVMAAGMYVELIVAAIAMLIWMFAEEPTPRLAASYVVLVCGVSTLIFNANPLLRYDGYYILSDLLDSVNLRREAADAYRAVVTRRLAGAGLATWMRRDGRGVGLAVYHSVSMIYRIVIVIAITSLGLMWARRLGLEAPLRWLITLIVVSVVIRQARRLVGVIAGRGGWRGVPVGRRTFLVSVLPLVGVSLLLLPTPRYRHAEGWLDAADASGVFVGEGGLIEAVPVELGQWVCEGEPLVQLRDEDDEFEVTKLQGQLRLARLRGVSARRRGLNGGETSSQWKSLQAVEEAITAQLRVAQERLARRTVAAPAGGVVIPPRESFAAKSRSSGERRESDFPQAFEMIAPGRSSLRERTGSVMAERTAWCRIASVPRLVAVMVVDGRDRSRIEVGSTVAIRLAQQPGVVLASRVASVSAIEEDHSTVRRRAAYRVLCELPLDVAGDGEVKDGMWSDTDARRFLASVGSPCEAVFHLPARSVWGDMSEWIGGWFEG